MVSERGLDVLRVIVQDYVASREPVGSKSIVDRYSFGVSAATIRNDMALLEEEELITAPHTSSGRIPTDKGYRVFVNQLADLRPLSAAQRAAIETFLGSSADLDQVLGRTVRLLSQLTHQVALVQYPSLSRSR
ncbi:MAG: heat-inducible transcriptional repressor HrcA, partial [Microbacteriaceae bacterium]|nr:heat-inducible transcriptional repressor HrcA [Microbacteriaceae bacterium]